ncbi:MAG: hypothetical protein MJZ54_06985 [Bacteroidaceae bacterium]|nr:hypothetical protein [Bacteroidaceae bacterium]
MKRILISLLLACVALNCTAQNELQKCIDNLPPARLIGTDSEQGHDRLDSLYYLNIMNYELPFKSEADKQYANGVIQGVLLAYNKDLPQHTGGFCSSNLLRTWDAIESRTIQMYYGEDLAPFTVGGKGHNYALLRTNSKQNPNYRSAHGLEWWLENTYTLKMRSFRLFGPLTADLYQNALRQAGIVKEENSNIVIETSHSTSNKKEILEAIKMLKGMYEASEKGMSDSFKRAIVSAINERIKAYLLPQDATIEEKIELFRTLSDIPGYQVRVSTVDGNHWKCHTFGWLADIYPQLNVSCITWAIPGNPECVTPGPGGESQPLNFLYKVMVNNKDLEGIK